METCNEHGFALTALKECNNGLQWLHMFMIQCNKIIFFTDNLWQSMEMIMQLIELFCCKQCVRAHDNHNMRDGGGRY